MLLLTLERIGMRQPATYAALIRQAERVSDLEANRAHVALAEYQGAIALVERLTKVRTIDSGTAQRLLEALAAVPFTRAGDIRVRSCHGCSFNFAPPSGKATHGSTISCWKLSLVPWMPPQRSS
jgi:hypothetical protein